MSPCPTEDTRGPCPEASGAPPPDRTGDPGVIMPLATSNAEAIEFVRFCRGRRRVGWPELYDEMILIACRGLFHGYGFEELGRRGVSFTLAELPRLAELVALVVADERPVLKVGAARRGRAVVGGVVGPDERGSSGGREPAERAEPAAAAAASATLATD